MKLLETLSLGDITLNNRVIMAPLTRARAGTSHIANDLIATMYAQRASAGLLIAEATMVAADGCAFYGEPGIFNDETVAGWRKTTDAVHAAGGKIFLQIWHPGRAAHSYLNQDIQPISSSNKAIRNDVIHTPKGKQPYETPRVLATEEIPNVVAMFKAAAENAKQAGFDGVQVHGAHGYLIDQFLRDSVNDRTDQYGGSLENRARLLLEVVDACLEVWPKAAVSVRISPKVAFNDIADSDPEALTEYVAKALSGKIGSLELRHENHADEQNLAQIARAHFAGVLLLNGGFDQASGEAAVQNGLADGIVYGKAFIANPDLVTRFAHNAELNAVDFATLYTPGEKGYTDYPSL